MTRQHPRRLRRRRLRSLLMPVLLVALALGWLAVPAPRAWACDCATGLGPAEYRDEADVVFTGVLVERDDPRSGAESRLHFEVTAVHKGEAAVDQVVVTAADGAACGLVMEPGDGAWLVFAHREDAEVRPGEVSAHSCGGTTTEPAPADWESRPPGPSMRGGVPPAVWWLGGAGVLVLLAGAIAGYRLWLRRSADRPAPDQPVPEQDAPRQDAPGQDSSEQDAPEPHAPGERSPDGE